jgi:hypothetical protein
MVSVPLAGVGTLVGGRLLSKAAEAVCEHGPEFQQKNDLYFLLKLTEEEGVVVKCIVDKLASLRLVGVQPFQRMR